MSNKKNKIKRLKGNNDKEDDTIEMVEEEDSNNDDSDDESQSENDASSQSNCEDDNEEIMIDFEARGIMESDYGSIKMLIEPKLNSLSIDSSEFVEKAIKQTNIGNNI
jgi:hypothetical protein